MKRLIFGFAAVTGIVYLVRRFVPLGQTYGGTFSGEPTLQVDDVTLARKVETELFRSDDVPKGQINVNAEYGRVVLRGEVPSDDMIRDLVERARSVDGVRDVENLLHVPGQEAPMHEG